MVIVARGAEVDDFNPRCTDRTVQPRSGQHPYLRLVALFVLRHARCSQREIALQVKREGPPLTGGLAPSPSLSQTDLKLASFRVAVSKNEISFEPRVYRKLP
jgi:hypothetical protein